MRQFRKHHLLALFEQIEKNATPLDTLLRTYFRANKAIGAHDRREISEKFYQIIRWRGLFDFLSKQPLSWETRLEISLKIDPISYINDEKIPLHIRMSFPKSFFNLLKKDLGEKKAIDFCLASNERAPITIRVNPQKASRDGLLDAWKETYPVIPCSYSEFGITFEKKFNFFLFEEFKQGKFEVQDEGSQLVASLIEAQPKNLILDYCAGSGGKTLAFAHKMKGQGQIFLHDIRPHILIEAKKKIKKSWDRECSSYYMRKTSYTKIFQKNGRGHIGCPLLWNRNSATQPRYEMEI